MSKLLVSVAGLALAAAASANSPFSVSGQGGIIPTSGTGGGTWPNYGSGEGTFTSSVNVGTAVKGITGVTLTGITHTWVGDLQITLRRPDGQEYTLFHRPGSTGASVGSSGDFLPGTNINIVESGGSTVPTSGNIASGTYNQSFGVWASGTGNTFNTGLSSISGAAGTWSLVIRDWAAGDTGSLTGWTLNGLAVPTPGAAALMGVAGLAGLRRRR